MSQCQGRTWPHAAAGSEWRQSAHHCAASKCLLPGGPAQAAAEREVWRLSGQWCCSCAEINAVLKSILNYVCPGLFHYFFLFCVLMIYWNTLEIFLGWKKIYLGFLPIFKWIICVFAIKLYEFLIHIWDINLLSDIWLANVSSHFIGCLILLMPFFAGLMLITDCFVCAFGVISKICQDQCGGASSLCFLLVLLWYLVLCLRLWSISS